MFAGQTALRGGLCSSKRPEGVSLSIELAHYVEEIPHDAVVGDRENRRIGVLIYSDDNPRVLHSGQMLDCAGDAKRDVHIGRDSLSRLADLGGIRCISCID